MKLKNIFIISLIITLAMPLLGVVTFAEEIADSPVAIPEYTVNIKYAEDSSSVKGIAYEPYVDPSTLTVGFKLTEDLPIGHVIYDNPDTAYIDGIRVNGETVDTLTVWITEDAIYDVTVKTVYEDNLLGDIGRIIDGTFDFKTLLENPVMLLMGVYYLLSIISIIVVTFTTAVFKNKEVKSADEIAAKVDESADNAVEKIRTEVTDAVLAEATPILQNILDATHNIVKALTLSTSKTKEAPLAMLDTLQKSADVNATAIIDDIRKKVSEGIKRDEDTRNAAIESLKELTHRNDTVEVPTDTPKSIF